MQERDLELYGTLLNEVRKALAYKDKVGISELPMSFDGVLNDMMYDTGVSNEALVLLVDTLIQDVQHASDEEILERFNLCERVLATIYERNKKLAELNQ